MFGEQSDFFHKVVRQSAGPHDLKLCLLSTQNMKRKRFQGSYEKIAISFPIAIQKYNKYMGGIDIMDQRKVSYQFDNRSKIKYYLRLVFDLIDIAVNSSRTAFNKSCED